MRIVSDMRINSEFKNMPNYTVMPGANIRVSNSFLPGSGGWSTCYVIHEEQPNDVDDNGNGQDDEVGAECNHDRSTNDNINDIKNKVQDSGRKNDNINLTNMPSRLLNLNESENENCNEYHARTSSMFSARQLSSNHCQSSNFSTDTSTFTLNQSPIDTSLKGARDHGETLSSNLFDVKSGHLVLIASDQNNKFVLSQSLGGSRTLPPSRCPVIVKIHSRGFDKYAILSSTRRHAALSSLCLKLKNSHVIQSPSHPSRFTVVMDGDDGKSFTFEASSPEVASQWMHAFSSNVYSYNIWNRQHPPASLLFSPVIAKSGQSLISESSLPPSAPHLSHLPLMPVLSESLDEDDEE